MSKRAHSLFRYTIPSARNMKSSPKNKFGQFVQAVLRLFSVTPVHLHFGDNSFQKTLLLITAASTSH